MSSSNCAYRSDLTDQVTEIPEEEWFTDDSSFVKDGVRWARYAMVNTQSHSRKTFAT